MEICYLGQSCTALSKLACLQKVIKKFKASTSEWPIYRNLNGIQCFYSKSLPLIISAAYCLCALVRVQS